MKIIHDVNIILPDRIIEMGSVVFAEEIIDIVKGDSRKYQPEEVIDGEGGFLAPGFIDIHVHGAGGRDTMEATPEALKTIGQTLAKYGVTSFLPATMTEEKDKILAALENIRDCRGHLPEGARVLGAHMEGPFINAEYRGAQAGEFVRRPDPSLVADYLDTVRLVTLAPELKGAEEFIRQMAEAGIVTAAGHSAAGYERMMAAREWGLEHVTHLYNAMPGLHHRRPGVVGAALNSDLSCELIADRIHISPPVLELTARIKAVDKIILVSDAMEAAGLGDSTYTLGGQEVTVEKGCARLSDGTLAGSTLTLDRAVRNMLEVTDLSLPEVVRMATLNPARLLGLENRIGQIKIGLRADLVLLDRELEVRRVFSGGRSL